MQVETTKKFSVVKNQIENDQNSVLTHRVARRVRKPALSNTVEVHVGLSSREDNWVIPIKSRSPHTLRCGGFTSGHSSHRYTHTRQSTRVTGIHCSIFIGSMGLKEPKCPAVCCHLNKLECTIIPYNAAIFKKNESSL